MKNKFKFIIPLAILTTTFACSDFLDIKPLDKMVLEDYWKTGEDVESTVLACYRAMEEDGFMERIILGGELRSDNVIVDQTKIATPVDIVYINDVTIKTTNNLLKWQDFYRVINYCNAILEYAPSVVDLDPSYTPGYMRAHLAEAYAIRALTYFYLVRLYRDVPYIDFPLIDDTQLLDISQTSGDRILYLLVEELTEAEKFALKSWGHNPVQQKGRVTKNMIRALLADIYLWLGEYSECIAACNRILPDVIDENQVINPELLTGAELQMLSNRISPANSFTSMFYHGNSVESFFELQFMIDEKSNSTLETFYGNSFRIGQLGAATSVLADDEGLFGENTNDYRGKSSYIKAAQTGAAQGFSQIFKYIGYSFSENQNGVGYNWYVNNNRTPHWIIYRLPDVYLMRAEALVERNEAGDLEEALAMVNITYMRSNPTSPPLDPERYCNSQKDMQELVLDERQREFLFEGKRWFDLLRLARKEDKSDPKGKDAHAKMLNYVIRKYTHNGDVVRTKLIYTDALYLPVHRDECVNNPALKQNPYYNIE